MALYKKVSLNYVIFMALFVTISMESNIRRASSLHCVLCLAQSQRASLLMKFKFGIIFGLFRLVDDPLES